jgi:hypothetical protein
MISTIAYPEKNVLHIRFRDNVTTTQFDEFHRELANLLQPLAEGFVLISDFTDLTEMDFACWKPVGYMMERMVQAGVGEVIRVLDDSSKDIGCGILSTFHYPASLPVKIFDNLPEVLERLELNRPREQEACWLPETEPGKAVERFRHVAV